MEQYDEIAKDYSKSAASGATDERVIREIIEPSGITAQTTSVLDIGCSEGTYIKTIARLFPTIRSLGGVDISSKMIEIASKDAGAVTFKVGSMDDLPYDDATFDIVYARHALHYTEDLKLTLKEVARVLKSSGIFYFIDSHPINALFLKPSHDYEKKEAVVFPTQWDASIKVQHPNFTFAEYLRAIKETGFELLSCSEGYGRDANMFPPYRIPTNLCFKLRKI